MLKTLKWVYDLGVKQERVRIARALENELAAMNNEFGVEHDMLREIPDSARQRKARLELKHATTLRVQEVINKIMRPQYEPTSWESTMFPDDKETK